MNQLGVSGMLSINLLIKDSPASYELPEHLGDLYSRSKASISEKKMAQLLAEFQDVFLCGPNDLGSTNGGKK